MNGEVKMKFNIKSDVDTTRKEIESALKNNEQEKQETQSYLNKKKNNKVKWDRTKWIISIILLLAGIIFVGVNNGLAYSTVRTGHKKYEDAGGSRKEMCAYFKRSEGSLAARLVRLGKISDRAEFRMK